MILYSPKISLLWIILLLLSLYLVWVIFKFFNLKKISLKICSIAGATIKSLGIVFIFCIIFVFQISDVIDYSTNNYDITQGVVTNFISSKGYGRTSSFESFEVKGVKFEYKDNIIRSGYRKTKANGGVIKGNGQYIKIGYINNEE